MDWGTVTIAVLGSTVISAIVSGGVAWFIGMRESEDRRETNRLQREQFEHERSQYGREQGRKICEEAMGVQKSLSSMTGLWVGETPERQRMQPTERHERLNRYRTEWSANHVIAFNVAQDAEAFGMLSVTETLMDASKETFEYLTQISQMEGEEPSFLAVATAQRKIAESVTEYLKSAGDLGNARKIARGD